MLLKLTHDVKSCVLPLCASKIVPSQSMFHKTLLGVPDTFSSFCSSLAQTTPTSRPLTGIRNTPCATLREGMQSGHLPEPLPHTRTGGNNYHFQGTIENEKILIKTVWPAVHCVFTIAFASCMRLKIRYQHREQRKKKSKSTSTPSS